MNNYERFSARNSASSCKKSCKILQEILQNLARCLTRSCKTSSKILHDNLAPAYARILQDSCTSKQSCKIISGKSCKKVAKLRARLQESCKMMCKIFYYLARFVQDLARLFCVLCVKFAYVCCVEIDACSTGRTPVIVKGRGRDACSWVSWCGSRYSS